MERTAATPAPTLMLLPKRTPKRVLPQPQAIRHYAEIAKTSRPIDLAVIHCSATRSNVNYPPERLIRDHLLRGFVHAGYHFYILRNGDLYSLRPLSMVGAHAAGHNERSIGICYEGGLSPDGVPEDTRTKAQKVMMDQLLFRLRELWPDLRVLGHRDLSPDKNGDGLITSVDWLKECPCFDARKL